MNTSNVLLSDFSGLDGIDVSNTSVSQPREGTKTEQSSFKRALEEQDTKVSGGESTRPGDTETEVKAPEPEEEATTPSYGSAEQDARREETDDVSSSPVFTPIITGVPVSKASNRNAMVTVDAWSRNVQASAMPGAEESIKASSSNSADKTNIGNRGEILNPGTLVISSPKGTEEGISLAGKAVGATRGETLDMNSLLGRSGGDQQSDLNKEGGQQAVAFRSRSGNEVAGSFADLTISESEVKPVNVRQVQLSAAFGRGDAGVMLDDSGSGKAGDESSFSGLKAALAGSEADSSAGISMLEGTKHQAKQPLQEISSKIVEQVREPLVQAVKKGVDHIQLRLKPDGLGELRIDLRVHGGRLNMQILTDNVTTRQVLEFGLPELKGQLADSGISVGDTNIEHDEGKGKDQNHAEHKDSHPQGRNNNKKENRSFREYFA